MIIGIGNKARQGKDTAGEYLNKEYGFQILHFADPIYDECRKCRIYYKNGSNIFYLKPPDEDFCVYEDPPEHMKRWIREKGEKKDNLPFDTDYVYTGMKNKDSIILQFWGTDFRRKRFGGDFWLKKIKKILENNAEKDYVLPDVRFKNEAKLVKSLGGVIWRIIRPGYKIKDRKTSHTSETEMDNYDYDKVIINDGTIEDLYKKVDRTYLELRKEYEFSKKKNT